MSRISIVDLEVFYCVGVTEEERANPQRLLVTVDMNYDFSVASVSDRIEKTIQRHRHPIIGGYRHKLSAISLERVINIEVRRKIKTL